MAMLNIFKYKFEHTFSAIDLDKGFISFKIKAYGYTNRIEATFYDKKTNNLTNYEREISSALLPDKNLGWEDILYHNANLNTSDKDTSIRISDSLSHTKGYVVRHVLIE